MVLSSLEGGRGSCDPILHILDPFGISFAYEATS
jgi:hypothetical protein